MKATHNGHCQVCGRLQAAARRGIAKHGYRVDWGYFHGTCAGSDELPIEVDHDITDSTIVSLLEQATELAATTADDITEVPVMKYDRKAYKHRDVYVNAGELALVNWFKYPFEWYRWNERVAYEVGRRHRSALQMVSHASFLEDLIKEFHNKPLTER